MTPVPMRVRSRRVLIAWAGLALLSAAVVQAQEWKVRGKYATTPMLLEYGERGTSADKDHNIAWFKDPADRARFKLEFRPGPDGPVAYVNGFPLDTHEMRGGMHGTGYGTPHLEDGVQGLGKAIFVMDGDGTIYVIMEDWIPWPDPSSHKKFRHSTIPAGQDVAAAGTIQAVNGKIVYMDPESGHYIPTNMQLVQVIKELESRGVSKSALKGKIHFGGRVELRGIHPGEAYLALDPHGDQKVEAGTIERAVAGAADVKKPVVVDPTRPVDETGLLKPDQDTPIPPLEAAKHAGDPPAPSGKIEPAKPTPPPDPEVVKRIEAEILGITSPDQIDKAFMTKIYGMDPGAAKIIGQIMGKPVHYAKSQKMAELRWQMDLEVWKKLLIAHPIRVELTNQGKADGIRSDLDYTLYHIARETGIKIEDLIAEHGRTWHALHGLTPDQVEVKIMNGDHFYPDWRTENLSEAEHQVRIRETLGALRNDDGTYSVPGAFKEQVHNRPLRDGHTQMLQYDPLLDQPGTPIEQQIVRDQGRTADIAERYRDVHGQYNHMNALGNLIQNKGEFFDHTGDGAVDAHRRAKYFNRVINQGLGNLRFFANDYAKIYESNLPPAQKTAMLEKYLQQSFGLLVDDTGKPLIDDATRAKFKRVIDISMQIELDKTGTTKREFSDARKSQLFGDYLAYAEAAVTSKFIDQVPPLEATERAKLVLAEQERLFELDQKRVLAEAVLAGLRHSVFRDLTPEGAMRNRVRFNPATQTFVMNDPRAAANVAFERATEVALFFELVNGLPDDTPEGAALKADLKKRALSTAPNDDLAAFYQSLDAVGKAEVDRFIAGDPDNPVQRSIDDLMAKQQAKAVDLLLKRKQDAVDRARRLGVVVDPAVIADGLVRAHILNARMWALSPYRRLLFNAAVKAVGTQVYGDFRTAFHENASGLMLASSAINLLRAWQAGTGLPRAVLSEAIGLMPGYIQVPATIADMVLKVYEGNYTGAAFQGGLLVATKFYPGLGNVMHGYNIVTGLIDLTHTYVVSRIDVDLTEQALKSRPRDENGAPLRDGLRARPNRFADAQESVYNGSGPGTPLFYGRYKNAHALAPVAVIDGVKYSDGSVPEDILSDTKLANSAGVEFAPEIVRMLTEANLKPGTPEWARKVWELKLKFGFDLPFYRRVYKVFEEKYKYITYYVNWPSPYNKHYLEECRLDVYDWYVQQPQGYKDELAGEARGLFSFFRDQTDKMQQRIAEQCAVVMGSMREVADRAEQTDRANMLAFNEAMKRNFDAERALLAAKTALQQRIRADEEKAVAALESKALELATRHQTHFAVHYPWTFATEELWPILEFDVRSIPSNAKAPLSIITEEAIESLKEGAPAGWKPGPNVADQFKPDADGWISTRPVTADFKFTSRLMDADNKEVARSSLLLPIVLYHPTVAGNLSVVVYGMGEKGDSSLLSGAKVTLDKVSKYTGADVNAVHFGRLKPGSYSVAVEPPSGDTYHGPGAGSGTISDLLVAKGPNAKESAVIVVRLPYKAPPKIVENPGEKKDGAGGVGGGKPGEEKKPGGPGGPGGPGEKKPGDKTGSGNPPGGPGSVTSVEEAIKNLGPLTSAAEKTRDDAKNSCKYIEAAAAQQELVNAAKSFLATSFPNGVPAQVQALADGFDAELAALKKAATAQEAANVHLRAGLAAVRARKGEAALAALEAASNTPDIPQCLNDQVMKLYNEIKADIEKRMLIIDKAVDAANNKCDFATAQTLGEQIEKEDATLSWVVNELPKIRDLNQRQKKARNLNTQAENKAIEAEQAVAAGKNADAKARYDQAIELARQALEAAPACEKANLSNLLDLPARKAKVDVSKVDQSLILLLDTSGSMSDENKMENAKQAAANAVKSLGPTTEVAVIRYGGGCDSYSVVADFTTDRAPVLSAIAGLSPGGGTPTAPAIGFAHGYMQKNARSKSGHIMLMTDGQNTCGSMTDAGKGVRTGNIPVKLDAVGFGVPENSAAQTDLGVLVRAAGNGNAYNANNASELIAAFRRAFITTQIKPSDPFVSGSAGTRLSTLFAAAIEALKQNDIRGAIGQFKSAVDQFPTSPAAQFNASLAYEAGGQPLQAMTHAQKYLALAPNAFDAGQVRERMQVLQKEQELNPRAIYAPTDCGALYRWAQQELRQVGSDAVRKARVYDIMTTAQRGDCAAAQTARDKYGEQYRRP